jgi:hypothetical protein
LAEFVLEVIQESESSRSIDRLVKSFGLSRRVMEEILADLVRGNYLWIDLNRGRVVPTGSATQQSNSSDNRGVLDVWQDHSTGAVIPLSMITSYRAEHPFITELAPLPYNQFSGFLEAADAHLISYLVRADPTLRFAEGGSWRLDRLLHRVRRGSQMIWVPLRAVPVGSKEVMVVEAPEIPSWITRSWTATYQRTALIRGAGDVRSQPRIPLEEAVATTSPLQHCQLHLYARRWAEHVQEHLNASQPPQSVQDIRGLEQLQSILQERLLSLARVEVRNSNGPSHVEAAILHAKNSVVLVFDALEAAAIAQIQVALATRGSRVDVQFVYNRHPHDDQQLLRGLADAGVRHLGLEGIEGGFIITDARQITVGDIRVLRSDAPALIVHGCDPAAAVLGLVQSKDIKHEELLWPTCVDERGERNRELDQAVFGEVGGRSAALVLGDLLDFKSQLVMAIQERKLEDRPQMDPQRREGLDATPDGRARSEGDVGPVSLAASQPDLWRRFSTLSAPLERPLAGGYSAFTYVDGAEQQEILARAALESPARSDTITLLSSLGSLLDEEPTIETLGQLLSDGWQINLVVPAGCDPGDRAATLRQSFRTPALRILALDQPPVPGALIVNDLVIVGTHQPLGERWTPVTRETFQLAFDSPALAGALTDLTRSAIEIHPYR